MQRRILSVVILYVWHEQRHKPTMHWPYFSLFLAAQKPSIRILIIVVIPRPIHPG